MLFKWVISGLFSLTKEHKLENNTNVATIPKMGMEWRVVFEFKPTEYIKASPYGWTSLLHLTVVNSVEGDYGEHLYIPAIFFHPIHGIYIVSSVSGNQNYEYKSHAHRPSVGKWSAIEIGQRRIKTVFTFYITIAGQEVHSARNNDTREFQDVSVYASNPWHTAQPGSIRGLTIESRLEGMNQINIIFPLSWNQGVM